MEHGENSEKTSMMKVFKALSNSKRLKMLNYLEKAKYAVHGSFYRKLSLNKSFITRALKILMDADLIKKEQLETTNITVYVINIEKRYIWYLQ